MASKNKSPPEHEHGGVQGAKAAGDAVAVGERSLKKQKTKEDSSTSNAPSSNDDDSVYQTMASLLANKLLDEGWLEGDVSKITKILGMILGTDENRKTRSNNVEIMKHMLMLPRQCTKSMTQSYVGNDEYSYWKTIIS